MMRFRFFPLHRSGCVLLFCCLPYLSGRAAPVDFEAEIEKEALNSSSFDSSSFGRELSRLPRS